MSDQPPEFQSEEKVRLEAYAAEQGGIVWVYLGLQIRDNPMPAYEVARSTRLPPRGANGVRWRSQTWRRA